MILSEQKLFILLFVFILTIIFSGTASATIINVHPGTNAIKNAVSSAHNGDTLKLSAGIYREHDIGVSKKLIITGPTTTGTPTAVIDAQGNGRVFNIYPGVTANLKCLKIQDGQTTGGGGGIYNRGTLTVNNCYIQNNFADASGGGILNREDTGTVSCTVNNSHINGNTATNYGGGIYNERVCKLILTGSTISGNTAQAGGGIFNYNGGTLRVTSSTIKNNIAKTDDGGGIWNYGNCTVTSSTIKNNIATEDGGGIFITWPSTITDSTISGNTANDGGGIYDDGVSMTVTGCDFSLNKATSHYGNAIDSLGYETEVHFNKFNDPYNQGYEVYQDNAGFLNAEYNWWGSNTAPDRIGADMGSVTVYPWLVLKISASKSLIGKNFVSTIAATLRYDSKGKYHSPLNGHVKDGILVCFTTTCGHIILLKSTVNGVATTTLTGGSMSGIANIYATLDNQRVHTSVQIDARPPTITSTTPTNLKTGISRTSTIIVKFAENINVDTYWSNIKVKNFATGKTERITKTIYGHTLYIKNNSKRSAYIWYWLYIPAGAVKDKAGNKLTRTYTFKFKTGAY